MKSNAKSNSSKRTVPSNSNQKLKHNKSRRYCNKVKKGCSSDTIVQAKENSHKKHPKMDYISKAIQAKLKDFETLCPPQKDLLQKSCTSILKQKKKVSSH